MMPSILVPNMSKYLLSIDIKITPTNATITHITPDLVIDSFRVIHTAKNQVNTGFE